MFISLNFGEWGSLDRPYDSPFLYLQSILTVCLCGHVRGTKQSELLKIYFSAFSLPPHKLFIKMVRDGQWTLCEEFCKAFNIHYENCVEFAGDVFLKSKRTTLALLAYNKARVTLTRNTSMRLQSLHQENNFLSRFLR